MKSYFNTRRIIVITLCLIALFGKQLGYEVDVILLIVGGLLTFLNPNKNNGGNEK